jgi:RNA polymerase sigma-70 factor (ECF subfamily)
MDARTLAQLLLEHAAGTRVYVQRRIPASLRSQICADDVLQDAWIAAYRSISSFRPRGPAAFERWLSTIVATRLSNAVRAARMTKRGGGRGAVRTERSSSLCVLFEQLAGPEKTPSRVASSREAAEAVGIVLGALPEDRRTAIRLRYLEGCSTDEIAARMNRTVSAVRGLLFHACNEMRGLLRSASHYLSGAGESAKAHPAAEKVGPGVVTLE